MRFYYYAETDSLYIDLIDRPGVESQEVARGIILDLDSGGNLVGIDIDNASTIVDLSRLDVHDLPISNFTITGAHREEELKLAEEPGPYDPEPRG